MTSFPLIPISALGVSHASVPLDLTGRCHPPEREGGVPCRSPSIIVIAKEHLPPRRLADFYTIMSRAQAVDAAVLTGPATFLERLQVVKDALLLRECPSHAFSCPAEII